LAVSQHLAVNGPVNPDTYFYIFANGPGKLALNFTNEVDASVSFSNSLGGAFTPGRSYVICYGDVIYGQYVSLGVEPTYALAMYSVGNTAHKRSVHFYGYAADANKMLVCHTQDTSLELFSVAVNGDITLYHDPTAPLHAATKAYVDAHVGGSLNLAANYAWTGTHSWSQRLAANAGITLGYPASLKALSSSGSAMDIFASDGTYYYIGPTLHDNGTAVGQYIVHLCGTGGYDGAPGTVTQHGPAQTWYFRAHINVASGYGITTPVIQSSVYQIYDGAAWQSMKIGAAGTGPGGAGRMLYID
jgi:hypothetical protein